MRPMVCTLLLLALGACQISGPGKLPSRAEWKPSRNKTPLLATAVEFPLAGLQIEVQQVTWIEEVHYGLFRTPQHYEYELLVEGICRTDDYQRLGTALRETPIRVLDENGQQIQHKWQPTLHFRGPQKQDGTYVVQGHHSLSIDKRRPAFYVVGERRLRLQ